MKNIIISMIASLMLFVSCEDVEPDRFVVDDVHVELVQSWGNGYPRYEVKIDNPRNLKIDRVGLRLKYHDKAATVYDRDEMKDFDLTAEGGRYVHDVNEFPYAFAGDRITAYAYVTVGGMKLGSGEHVMVVQGNPNMEITSAKFVLDDPSLTSTNRGTIYISGNFSPRHLIPKEGSYITLPDDNAEYDYSPGRLVIRGCYAEAYGKASIVLRHYNKDYIVDMDIPGELSIDGVDKYNISLSNLLTLTVSGMREDCTYDVQDMTIVSMENGTIKCKPTSAGYKKVRLIENHGTFSMSAYSEKEIRVWNY